MFSKVISLFVIVLLLSGCSDNVRAYFQKSANNKLIDRKGFEGGKRKPLYNKKYISLAKSNVSEGNLDDDEADSEDDTINSERINPSQRNREMYRKMIKRDEARIKQQKLKTNKDDYDAKYPSLNVASNRLKKSKNNTEREDKLEKELAEIKALLQSARQDLAKYKCPMPNSTEQTTNHKSNDIMPKKQNTNKPKPLTPTPLTIKKKFLSSDEDVVNTNQESGDINQQMNNKTINEQKKKDGYPKEI